MEQSGLKMAARLIKALRENDFVLYYQTIAPVAAPDNEPAYQEILVRFREEEQKLLPPGAFFPILEEHKLMPLLDRWVVLQVLKWSRGKQATHPKWRGPRSSVNLSMDSVRDPVFGNYVLQRVQASGVPAEALSFEIPVSGARANVQFLAGLIPPLRSAGCSFALSGFLGDSVAFELAASLGIAVIKIDGSMVSSISRDAEALEQLAAVNRRCRKMGMRTVTERVEDAATLNLLRGVQVDYAQGFGIEHPRMLT